ncbi:MAG TPA: hypothetical protein VK982_11515, partial [Bacteroidales bacterium]|nr:hypothetical protein [Bacteroidales bacterium]
EAFSKFGSDLDAATMAVLDKGAKNVEILKQGQYSPMPVEKQIAILYCGTKGLLEDVPVEKIKAFEKDFLDRMEMQHEDVLKKIKEGELNEEATKIIESVVEEVASKYKKS